MTPGISPSRRSSGAATVAAMVEGSAPGRLVVTWIVGNSTFGIAATGRNRYATAPVRNMPMDNRIVAIGRVMNGSEKFSAGLPRAGIKSVPGNRSAF